LATLKAIQTAFNTAQAGGKKVSQAEPTLLAGSTARIMDYKAAFKDAVDQVRAETLMRRFIEAGLPVMASDCHIVPVMVAYPVV
jgi:5-aminolevulinate synthase